ncbi:hypothetical protein FOA52_000673 [Chlamydomonas sp. UWO 241]|nr:hypothetical protein FOA52_000673 [Chlamydomonas sp. UWO 241]
MQDACASLPQPETCSQLVTQLLPLGLRHIAANPGAACSAGGVCGSEGGTQWAALRSVGDTTPCDECMMKVLEARMVINNPTVQAEIVNVTLVLCDRVPPYQEQCREYVTKYSPFVFEEINKYFKPDVVCKLLMICPSSPHASAGGQHPGVGREALRHASLASFSASNQGAATMNDDQAIKSSGYLMDAVPQWKKHYESAILLRISPRGKATRGGVSAKPEALSARSKGAQLQPFKRLVLIGVQNDMSARQCHARFLSGRSCGAIKYL